MNRPFMIVALVLAVIGVVFLLADLGGSVALFLFVAALVLTIVGIITGR